MMTKYGEKWNYLILEPTCATQPESESWGSIPELRMVQHDRGESICGEQVKRIVNCVNACAGMDDPEAEIKRLRENAEIAESECAFCCPECRSIDVKEFAYEDDCGSMECVSCGYIGTPGEDFSAQNIEEFIDSVIADRDEIARLREIKSAAREMVALSDLRAELVRWLNDTPESEIDTYNEGRRTTIELVIKLLDNT